MRARRCRAILTTSIVPGRVGTYSRQTSERVRELPAVWFLPDVGLYLGDAQLLLAHLEGADLGNAHLEHAYLKGAYLRGARLAARILKALM
jgi:hypothetical protein